MVKQFAFNIEMCKCASSLHELYELVSIERRERLNRYVNERDRLRCMFAEILLRYALSMHGVVNDQIQFAYESYGKPKLKNINNLHFNLSHSGDWVVCAISDFSVGIDVEEIKDRNYAAVYRHCLAVPELQKLLAVWARTIQIPFCSWHE